MAATVSGLGSSASSAVTMARQPWGISGGWDRVVSVADLPAQDGVQALVGAAWALDQLPFTRAPFSRPHLSEPKPFRADLSRLRSDGFPEQPGAARGVSTMWESPAWTAHRLVPRARAGRLTPLSRE